MIEIKKRTHEQMQMEYHQMCMRLGEIAYTIYAHQQDLSGLNAQIFKLNQEAAELKKKEKEEATQQDLKEVSCQSSDR